ncbi:MAG: alkaline phosphatase family protein [Motilibacteraceae bacterium]
MPVLCTYLILWAPLGPSLPGAPVTCRRSPPGRTTHAPTRTLRPRQPRGGHPRPAGGHCGQCPLGPRRPAVARPPRLPAHVRDHAGEPLQVLGDRDPHAPYINALADRYGLAANYYGVTHPSMPNYVASIAGDNFGIQDDEDGNVVDLDRTTLVDQLEGAHKSWAAYLEALPADKTARFGPTVDGKPVKLYAKKHNPFVLFENIAKNPQRMADVKDYDTSFAADLAGKHVPNFVWISPDQCNDMHGGVSDPVAGRPETPCPYSSAKNDANDVALKQKADAFVRKTVSTIMHSPAWTQGSAIFIVTDENDYTGNEETGGWEDAAGLPSSPYVPAKDPRVSADWPGGTYGGGLIPAVVVTSTNHHHVVSTKPYNHYSMLASIEENFGLPLLRHAGDKADGVRPMDDLLRAGHRR